MDLLSCLIPNTYCELNATYKGLQQFIHPVGENLQGTVYVQWVKVVQVLKAGIPLVKVDCLCELLEEDSTMPTCSSNLRQLIPFILREEVIKIKRERKRVIHIL